MPLFSYFIGRNKTENNSTSNANTFFLNEKESISLPTRLKIPSINIDTAVEYVGLTSDGTMDVPAKPEDVAWFNLGPVPGGPGNAVVAGHSGYKDNKPAIFDNLYKLQKGDKVYAEDSKGVITAFVVKKIESYKENESVPEVFVSNDGLPHLNLITCSGPWNEVDKTHSNRLVVFTDKIK